MSRSGGGEARGGQVEKIMSAGLVTSPAGLFFATLDGDGDYTVTGSEFDAALARHWEKADADANGLISSVEYDAWAAAALGSRETLPNRLSFDVDLSGSISAGEFEAGWRREYAGFDINEDGALHRGELLARLPRRPSDMPADMRRQMRPPAGQAPPGGMPPRR